jgi:CheY-like chemotaxis protein
MSDQLRAVTFDMDEPGLTALKQALPGWRVDAVNGATALAPNHDWDPGRTDLVVVMSRHEAAETLALCRLVVASSIFTTNQEEATGRWRDALEKRAEGADPPLLVLLRTGQQSLSQSALDAGADGCLLLPIDAKELANMLAQARQGNRPGRHTRSLDRAQCGDSWRDDGGQG